MKLLTHIKNLGKGIKEERAYMKWLKSQEMYVEWSKNPLDENYIKQIQEIGRKFATFVGTPLGRCLDIGFGNGMISGKTYDEVGYLYLNKAEGDYVVGVDPLPMLMKPSWINAFIQGRIEDVSTTYLGGDGFDTIVMAGCFDHFQKPESVLRVCKTLLKPSGRLNIYVAAPLKRELLSHDSYHPYRPTVDEIKGVIREYFNEDKIIQTPYSAGYDMLFIKCALYHKVNWGEHDDWDDREVD